ncbi:MAG: hypothetical protein WCK09_07150 [Bacteroidota bacterium]
MKATYYILFILIFTLATNPNYGQRLKGPVKSYKDSYYSVIEKYGKIKKGPRLNDTTFHDQHVSLDGNGNVMQVAEFNADGTINCEYLGRCDYKDNNAESMFVRFEHGKKIEQKPFVIETVKYPSGELCEMAYENDAKGLPTEETILDLMGNMIFKISIKRDEKDNALEYKFSDGSVYQYKYDDLGNRVEWISHTASGNKIITSWTYDANGNLMEENINDFFKTAYKFHYEHNTFKYLFDGHGNWIERTDFEHDIPQRIVIRTIEYSKSL